MEKLEEPEKIKIVGGGIDETMFAYVDATLREEENWSGGDLVKVAEMTPQTNRWSELAARQLLETTLFVDKTKADMVASKKNEKGSEEKLNQARLFVRDIGRIYANLRRGESFVINSITDRLIKEYQKINLEKLAAKKLANQKEFYRLNEIAKSAKDELYRKIFMELKKEKLIPEFAAGDENKVKWLMDIYLHLPI